MPEEKKESTRVKLNEREMTSEEFEKAKADLEKKPGVTVVPVRENEFRSRIKG